MSIEKYERVILIITEFDEEDVITTSNVAGTYQITSTEEYEAF